MNKNITGDKETQEKLRILSHTVEHSPCATIITDEKGIIEYVNLKFVQTTGYTSEEVIGKDPSILKSGEMPSEEYKQLWDTITTGREWQGEFHNRKKTGEFSWVYAHISPIKNSEGIITHFVGILQDITERKQMEQTLKALNELLEQNVAERTAELEESEEKLRKISALTQDAVVMIDNEERVSFWNKTAEKMFAYSEDEALGQYLHKLIVPEKFHKDYLKGIEKFHITRQGPNLNKTIALVALRKDNTEFPIELSLTAVKIKEMWNVIGVARDTSVQK